MYWVSITVILLKLLFIDYNEKSLILGFLFLPLLKCNEVGNPNQTATIAGRLSQSALLRIDERHHNITDKTRDLTFTKLTGCVSIFMEQECTLKDIILRFIIPDIYLM